jgi:hypothetical protein
MEVRFRAGRVEAIEESRGRDISRVSSRLPPKVIVLVRAEIPAEQRTLALLDGERHRRPGVADEPQPGVQAVPSTLKSQRASTMK